MAGRQFSREGIRKLDLSKQQQTASSGATAVQAQGPVTINQGLSIPQMTQIMQEVRDVTATYTKEALQRVEARADDFEKTILEKFEDREKTNSEAFRDPDFQMMLRDTQRAYVRSGDQNVKMALADIIARRSLAADNSRLALTLNDAAERAPRLVKIDFSILSLCYLARYTRNQGIGNPAEFAGYVKRILMPFVGEAQPLQAAFWHLEAQSCGRLGMGEAVLRELWKRTYAGVLGQGITMDMALQAAEESEQEHIKTVLIPCFHDKSLFQPMALSLDIFEERFGHLPISATTLKSVWNAFADTVPNRAKLIDMLKPDVPDIEELFRFWDDTPIKQFELNSVGIAIGHANASRIIDFSADLGIWVND